ncbi:cytidine deaminase [Niabella terrae]
METASIQFSYQVAEDLNELGDSDRELVQAARTLTLNAYAPYSGFQVAAVARLADGTVVQGTNHENASFPVGVCAERILLGAITTGYPDARIDTVAVSYRAAAGKSDRPISPCGMCRQALREYEERFGQPIRLLLSGQEGRIYLIPQAGELLPLAFGSGDLK